MRTITRLAVAAALVLGLTVGAQADEQTLSGTIICAKCTLKKADACQDVLLVKADDGTTTEYYVAKNEVLKEAGHQCSKESKATVTGTVTEKDGKRWIAASKIEKQG